MLLYSLNVQQYNRAKQSAWATCLDNYAVACSILCGSKSVPSFWDENKWMSYFFYIVFTRCNGGHRSSHSLYATCMRIILFGVHRGCNCLHFISRCMMSNSRISYFVKHQFRPNYDKGQFWRSCYRKIFEQSQTFIQFCQK